MQIHDGTTGHCTDQGMHTTLTTVVSCFLLLGGCNVTENVGEDPGRWTVESGVLVFYGDTSDVDLAADTVQTGEQLRVRATTFGNGCVRGSGMRTEVEGRRAVLTPLDSVYSPGPNEACTDELKVIRHTGEVSFKRAGAARVVIQGKRQGRDIDGSEDIQLERTVVVE